MTRWIDDLRRALPPTRHEVVTRAMLRQAGISASAIQRGLASGALTLRHRGVYCLSPNPGVLPCTLAAVLACGRGAAASDATAARLHGILPAPHPNEPLEGTAPGLQRRRPGLVVRSRSLPVTDTTTVHGIPCTTVLRTPMDLASSRPGRELEQVLASAIAEERVSVDGLRERIRCTPGRRGAGVLTALLREGSFPVVQSEAERAFLELVRRGGIQRPRTNVVVAGYLVDAVWEPERVIVELDGYASHGGRKAFAADRERDAVLAAAGYRVLRFTWGQATREPHKVLVILARVLPLRA